MDLEIIDVQLTPEERSLILQHGYPFPNVRAAIEGCRTDTIETIPIDDFELERLLADLCISINDLDGPIQLELNELYERLEYAQRTGDGMLFDL